MKVLIIGAGLGGLCLAQGLRKEGIEAVVFERDLSSRHRGQGHRVHIDDRGESALRDCLPGELFEVYLATRGQPSERFMLISAEGERLAELPVPQLDDGNAMIRTGRGVSRLTLKEIMTHRLDVRYGKCFERYTEEGDRVVAHFADGTSETGDLLVGADGIGSAVRKQRLPEAQVIDIGVRWIGGKSPVTDEIVASLPEGLETAFAAVTGMDPAMMVGYLLFENDPRTTGERLVPGLQLSDPGDYVMWAITLPKERLDDSAHHLPGAELHRKALEFARSAHPAMRAIVEQAWPEQTFHLMMGTSVPLEPWPSSSVTLLGDAIHAMPPARGSGSNTALGDAASLVRSLAAGLPVSVYEDDLVKRGFAAVRASSAAMEQVAKGILQV